MWCYKIESGCHAIKLRMDDVAAMSKSIRVIY